MSTFDERVINAQQYAVDLVEEYIIDRGESEKGEPIPYDTLHESAFEASDDVPSIYTATVWQDWADKRAWEYADEFSAQFGTPVEEWRTGDGREGMEAFAVCVLQEIAKQEIYEHLTANYEEE